MAGFDDNTPAHLLWAALLADKAALVPRATAAGLAGAIEFTVDLGDQTRDAFHILCRGDAVTVEAGPADNPEARVDTTEADVRAMLLDPDPPADALRVSGDFELFVAVFEALCAVPATGDWLQMRGAR